MALLGSKRHTAGDTRRWEVDYSRFLGNAVELAQVEVASPSATCMIGDVETQGAVASFFLTGGVSGETLTVALQMSDTEGNIRNDTLAFTVIAP